MSDDDLVQASRRAWSGLESLHVIGYFAEETTAEYVRLGLDARLAYFPARAAAMGAVGPGVSAAAFYVFAPWLHAAALPGAWDLATPEQLVTARRAGMTAALERIVGSPDVTEALGVVRRVCAALEDGRGWAGRPLYAAHAGLDWPEDDLLALWHGATLVREHRGDGHVAALVTEGVDPVEATVLDGVWSGKTGFLRKTRGWTEDEYAAAAERLAARDWLDDAGEMTDHGRTERTRIEAATDAAAVTGWAAVGVADTRRVAELVRPLRDAVVASGVLPGSIKAALGGTRRATP